MLNDLCFEVIQTCTNNCKFCSSCASMEATHIIEFELFKKVIDYIIANGGLKEISISGGEPFLHKDLIKMVQLCKSYNIKTNLYTSGVVKNYLKGVNPENENLTPADVVILNRMKKSEFYHIDYKDLIALKECGLDKIVFDFQSADVDTYNYLMGTKNNTINLLDSILYSKRAGLFTEAHFIPMKYNYKEIEDILELCDLGGIDRLSILKFVPQGRGRENMLDLQLNTKELNEFCSKVETLKNKYNVDIRLGIPVTKENEHLCTAGHDKLSIRYDGMVLPCVAFKEMDTKKIESIFIKNGIPFKLFSIRDRLDMLISKDGDNKIPICKQVYENIGL